MSTIILGLMRAVLVSLIVLLLMGPSEMPPSGKKKGRPALEFMLDTSASMATADMGEQSRVEFARSRWLSPDLLSRLNQEYTVRVSLFDERVRRTTPASIAQTKGIDATGDETFVVGSVEQMIGQLSNSARSKLGTKDQPPDDNAGTIVLLSDGRESTDRAVEPVAAVARERGVAILGVLLGGPRLQMDVAVSAAPAQEYLLVNEEGQLIVNVYQSGADGSTVRVGVKGEKAETVKEARFGGRSVAQLNFPIKESQPGQYEYRVKVDVLEGEVETANNTQSVFIEVVPERMKILLVEGEPGWDTKFLAQSLRRDDRVSLSQVSQVTRQRRESIVSRGEGKELALPVSASQWRVYDAVILGRSVERVLSADAAAGLVTYVGEMGGRVLMARGRPVQGGSAWGANVSLSVLEPVITERVPSAGMRMMPTDAGWDHPCFDAGREATGDPVMGEIMRSLPSLGVAVRDRGVKPGTVVLARGRSEGGLGGELGVPLVATMPYGRGMVAAVYADGLWRWSLGAKEVQQEAGLFDRFWSSMVRWMVLGAELRAGQAVSMRLSSRNVDIGDMVRVDVTARDETLARTLTTLEINDPSGERQTIALAGSGGLVGRRSASFRATRLGSHLARLQDPTTGHWIEAGFVVRVSDRERVFTASDPHRMRALAEQSGGMMLDRDKPEKLESVLRHQTLYRKGDAKPVYVWDRPWLLTLILVWAGLEWIGRRWMGML